MWWQRARQRRGGGVRGGCMCFFTFLLLFVVRGLTAMFVFFVERQRTANNSVTPSAPSISPSVCIAFFTVRHEKTHGTQNCRASREMVHYKGLFAEQSTAEQPLPQAREKKITEKPLSCVFFFTEKPLSCVSWTRARPSWRAIGGSGPGASGAHRRHTGTTIEAHQPAAAQSQSTSQPATISHATGKAATTCHTCKASVWLSI
jgi:hypothetical protein